MKNLGKIGFVVLFLIFAITFSTNVLSKEKQPSMRQTKAPFNLHLKAISMKSLPHLKLTLQNTSNKAKIYLLQNHDFLQPCELILTNTRRGKIPPFDERHRMKYDNEIREEHFASLSPKAKEVLHEETFTRNEDGTYALRWGTYRFRDCPAGRYTAQVIWKILMKKHDLKQRVTKLETLLTLSNTIAFYLP